MSKENLFELIRKEEVIVWAGAGMSMYAGYPSGVELCKMLYNDLNLETQQEIGPGLSHSCGKIKDEIEVFTLLSKITNGDKFIIFYQNKPVHTGAYIMMKPLYEQLHAFLAFFDGLRQIEKYYQLIFNNLTFDAIDTKNSSVITEILAFTEGGYVEENFKEGMKIDFDKDPSESARELDLIKNLPKDVFQLCAVNEHVIGLFGHQFNLGFKVYHIVKPEISNKSRAMNGMDQFFHLKSKKNKRFKFFTKAYMGASF